MNTSITISITSPTDTVNAHMSGGKIPVISFGPLYGPQADLMLNTDLLTSAEISTWLRSLAAAATELAALAEGAVLAGGGS